MRVIWKTSWGYIQYLKEINYEVREFDLSGRVAGRRFVEAEGGGSQQVTEFRDRGTQWVIGGSSGLQRSEPMQNLRRLTQSSAGNAHRNTQTGTGDSRG